MKRLKFICMLKEADTVKQFKKVNCRPLKLHFHIPAVCGVSARAYLQCTVVTQLFALHRIRVSP